MGHRRRQLERRFVPQAAPQAKKLLPQAAPQARRLLPHHRQEGFCRTTGKKVFAAPQARGLLPHLRQDGFVASQRTNNISLPLQIRVFLLLTGNKSKDKTISTVNLQILPEIETGVVYLETELVLPG